jgi:hypothetical protein
MPEPYTAQVLEPTPRRQVRTGAKAMSPSAKWALWGTLAAAGIGLAYFLYRKKTPRGR